jgi:hypothetical protein
MDLHAADLAVESPGRKLALQVGLHLQRLQPDLFRGDGNWAIAGWASIHPSSITLLVFAPAP